MSEAGAWVITQAGECSSRLWDVIAVDNAHVPCLRVFLNQYWLYMVSYSCNGYPEVAHIPYAILRLYRDNQYWLVYIDAGSLVHSHKAKLCTCQAYVYHSPLTQ